MRNLTREHSATSEFTRAASHLTELLDFQGEALKTFTAQFADALTLIGESELHARQMERCEALNIQDHKKQHCQEKFGTLNERGRGLLSTAITKLNELRQDAEKDSPKGKRTAVAKVWKERMYDLLVDLDVKVSDIKELKNIVDDYSTMAIKGGLGEVSNFIETKLQELQKVRGEPGRGAETNIAWWKVVGIAVFLGVSLWAIFKCTIFGCSVAENIAYGTVALIGILLIVFC